MTWFKNMKLRMKMMVSFGLVIALMVGISTLAVIEFRSMEKDYNYVFDSPMEAEVLLIGFRSEMRELRREMANLVMFIPSKNEDRIKNASQAALVVYNECLKLLDTYEALILADSRMSESGRNSLFAQVKELRISLEQYKKDIVDPVISAGQAGDYEQAIDAALAGTTIVGNLTKYCDNIINENELIAKNQMSTTKARADFLVVVIIIIAIVAFLIAILFASYVAGIISKPLIMLSGFFKKASATGDVTITPEEKEILRSFVHNRDEIGYLMKDCSAYIDYIQYLSKQIDHVSRGDLTSEIKALSQMDTIGLSMQTMLESLNTLFVRINSATDQVSVGSKQIADGAQLLAQGSTEQAASIEELSGSVAEIAEQTKLNANMAIQAAKLAETIKASAEKGSRQMDEMTLAVNEINEASGSISKVIKVIDDIAFQTNILALNAAVEAARAGQHGKGFAVVAEEVRSLAAKSAEAAKDTSVLIENSIEKAGLGVNIARETEASLNEIVTGIGESNHLVGEIAKYSEHQSVAIDQINVGIDQVAQVIQQNSATSQESAAASQEMSSLATMLEELIAQFKIK